MSLTAAINQATSQNIKSTSRTNANVATSTAASDAAPIQDTGFSNALLQATSSIPSKALSTEVLAATVPSTTIQTSSYVFDPLGVVGIIPESNVFLQAIRQMMGKPADTPATPSPKSTSTSTSIPAPTPVTAAVIAPSTANGATSFNALPAAVSAMPAPAPIAKAATPTAADASTTDFMSSLEAQLSYQNLASTGNTEIALMDALEEDQPETQSA